VPFTALLGGYVISVAGTSMSAVALPWLVLTRTGSAVQTGLVSFAELAPYVLAQVLAGPLVDRLGLTRSFVRGNAGAAVAVGAIPVLAAVDGLVLPALLALVAVAGAVRGAADCANGALVPATATAGGIPLERAAGLTAAANRTALLVGAPLAGLLTTVIGAPAAVAVDAGTFAVAAAVGAAWVRLPAAGVAAGGGAPAGRRSREDGGGLRPVPLPDGAAGAGEGGSAVRRYGRDLATGLRFLRGDRLLLGIVTTVALMNVLDQGLSTVLLPVWVREKIGSAGALGLIGGVGGLGTLLGSLLGGWLAPRLPRRAIYTAGGLLGGAPRFLVLALAGTLAPVIGVTLVAEVFAGVLNPVIGATSYERIPVELRARVLGTIRASAWVGVPFGALLGGYAAALGTRPALLAFGCCYLLVTLAPLVFPAWRELRRPDAGVPASGLAAAG
jgi:MFS family permease